MPGSQLIGSALRFRHHPDFRRARHQVLHEEQVEVPGYSQLDGSPRFDGVVIRTPETHQPPANIRIERHVLPVHLHHDHDHDHPNPDPNATHPLPTPTPTGNPHQEPPTGANRGARTPGTNDNRDAKGVRAAGHHHPERTHLSPSTPASDARIGAGHAGRTEQPRTGAGRADASESEARPRAAGRKGVRGRGTAQERTTRHLQRWGGGGGRGAWPRCGCGGDGAPPVSFAFEPPTPPSRRFARFGSRYVTDPRLPACSNTCSK
ncbi:hypothetical protein BD410DRAFT_826553 [Rickenella mellea]|uniref:Uncharacterized protein n=1 Tax=Rickenella mellea TaxID=50990 RepID=A0A4Y7QCF3_9AGAM|nr:hypothetical protein BD410DRAFT_826553 [Rickenella mellea]